MPIYDETTVWMRKDAKSVLDALCDFHDVKIVDMLALLIYSFSLSSPESREALLDIGEKVQFCVSNGMPLNFEDSLDLPQQYAKFVLGETNEKPPDKD